MIQFGRPVKEQAGSGVFESDAELLLRALLTRRSTVRVRADLRADAEILRLFPQCPVSEEPQGRRYRPAVPLRKPAVSRSSWRSSSTATASATTADLW